jgi:hypothetical protein
MASCNFCKTRNLQWINLNSQNTTTIVDARPSFNDGRLLASLDTAPRWQLQNIDGTRHSCVVARVYYRARAMNNNSGRAFMAAVDAWLNTHPTGATSFVDIFPELYTNNRSYNTDEQLIEAFYLQSNSATTSAAPVPVSTALPNDIEASVRTLPLLPLPAPVVIDFTQATNRRNGALNWRGLWGEGIQYEQNDVIVYASHIYVATFRNMNIKPGNGSWTNLTGPQQEQLFRTMAVEPVERTPVNQQVKRAIKI